MARNRPQRTTRSHKPERAIEAVLQAKFCESVRDIQVLAEELGEDPKELLDFLIRITRQSLARKRPSRRT